MPLFIKSGLGEHTAQFYLTCLGLTIFRFPLAVNKLFLDHRNPCAIHANVHLRNGFYRYNLL